MSVLPNAGRVPRNPAGRVSRSALALVLVIAVSGCHNDRPRSRTVDSAAVNTGPTAIGVEDTVLSVQASLHRFRENLVQPQSLTHAAPSRAHLARRYVAALATHDTSALARLHITPAEFAWFYYPESVISQAPYNLPAGIAWFELRGGSEKGLQRALKVYGGRHLDFQQIECPAKPVRYGGNVLWNKCRIHVRDETGAISRLPLIATIVERDGQFKIASAANDL